MIKNKKKTKANVSYDVAAKNAIKSASPKVLTNCTNVVLLQLLHIVFFWSLTNNLRLLRETMTLFTFFVYFNTCSNTASCVFNTGDKKYIPQCRSVHTESFLPQYRNLPPSIQRNLLLLPVKGKPQSILHTGKMMSSTAYRLFRQRFSANQKVIRHSWVQKTQKPCEGKYDDES